MTKTSLVQVSMQTSVEATGAKESVGWELLNLKFQSIFMISLNK